MNLGIFFQLATMLPSIIQAIQTLLSSSEAQTLEQAIGIIINHVTPGAPNSPALSHAAPAAASLREIATAPANDFQAPKG